MRIGICTGGGDCPGLNAAIRAIVKSMKKRTNIELLGIINSFKGLQEDPPQFVTLELDDVTDIYFKGGTILGTYNKSSLEEASYKSYLKLIKRGYELLKLDGILAIGGEGTQNIAKSLTEMGINIIGIPKTIDNDLPETERTIGFATCVDLVSESITRLQSTAESHDRIMLLEVMGRDSGFLALHGGLAGGAHIILIPEIPVDYESVCERILARKKIGRNYTVIVVSEGVKIPKGPKDQTSSVSAVIAHELSKRLNMDTRVTVLGHLQRGGTPIPEDRILATKLGVFASLLVEKKEFGKFIAVDGSHFRTVDYKDLKRKVRRKISLDDFTITTAESIGICLGRKIPSGKVPR